MAIITKNNASTIFGTSSSDVIDVSGNSALSTSVFGGLGNDIYFIDVAQAAYSAVAATADDVIFEDVNGGIDTVQIQLNQFTDGGNTVGSNQYTLGENVENLVASLTDNSNARPDFILRGNALANVMTVLETDATSNVRLIGEEGNDKLIGNINDDDLDGGTGNDTMIGGLGDDQYSVDSAKDIIQESLNGGIDVVFATSTYTLAANIENLILGRFANINATGNAVDNALTGREGNNVLSGLDGDDQLIGDKGNDTLIGGNGADRLFGEDDNDLLDGGAGDDDLQGGLGNDNLLGGAGNDVLNGDQGADKLNGGAGDDTYLDVEAADIVTDSGVGGSDTVFAIEQLVGDLGAGIENLVLGSGITNGRGNALANFITGNNAGNVLFGLAGNDILNGDAGNDVLDGGEGNDVLDGGTGNDLMRGGNGNDVYIFNAESDAAIETSASGGVDTILSNVSIATLNEFVENVTLTGGGTLFINGNARDNSLNGNAGDDALFGDTGKDKLFGFAGNDTLQGGDDKDTLDGGTDVDTMAGGLGDDVYFVDNTTDIVTEDNSAGVDLVNASATFTLTNNVENLTLIGGASISGTGNTANNFILGNIGNNTLDGGLGIDTLKGGKGNDTYIVIDNTDVLTELANEGTDTVTSIVDFTLGANFENLTLTSNAIKGTGNALNNRINGNASNNSLTGGDGNDTLFGAAGIDTLVGGNGNDTLDCFTGGSTNGDSMVGGAGNDLYVIGSASVTIVELLGGGIDTIRTIGGSIFNLTDTKFANIENFINGSDTDMTVIGNNLNNNILGEDFADDNLSGGNGNDTLAGGSGNNILIGGLGDDTYTIGFGTDTITELDGQGKDTVLSYGSIDFSVGTLANAFIENITLISEYSATVKGNAANNIITGNDDDNQLLGLAGNDTLIGNAGDDELLGGLGADAMFGGLGNDLYEVDSIGDKVTELANSGLDTVYSSIAFTLGANVEQLVLTGSANVNGTGNALSNIIVGNDANNSINGGAGNDTLLGGKGNDILTGGLGEDQFILNDEGSEKVTDYTAGEDRLGLIIANGVSFTGAGGTLTASQFSNVDANFIVGQQGLDADNSIMYQQATGNLYYDRDGSAGVFSAVLIADFKDGLTLAATDFFNG